MGWLAPRRRRWSGGWWPFKLNPTTTNHHQAEGRARHKQANEGRTRPEGKSRAETGDLQGPAAGGKTAESGARAGHPENRPEKQGERPGTSLKGARRINRGPEGSRESKPIRRKGEANSGTHRKPRAEPAEPALQRSRGKERKQGGIKAQTSRRHRGSGTRAKGGQGKIRSKIRG